MDYSTYKVGIVYHRCVKLILPCRLDEGLWACIQCVGQHIASPAQPCALAPGPVFIGSQAACKDLS